MSAKPTVLILGATGATGQSILKGLVESNAFNVEALVRPSSSAKPEVEALRQAGIAIRHGDSGDSSVADLTQALKGVDILVSAIGFQEQLAQLRLVDAAKAAGIKRFIPCGFITVAPAGDVMKLRDEKEEVYNYMKKAHVPYTVIDVGYWHQISLPRVPSGKYDYAILQPANEVFAGGEAPNILTDLRDIGPLVAQIILDERTLNKYVYTCGDALTQKEIVAIVEETTGEKVSTTIVTAEELIQRRDAAKVSAAADPSKLNQTMVAVNDYQYSKYVRGDNSPAYAKYLGYLDSRELYPTFKTRSFRDYLQDALEGKAGSIYANVKLT